MNNKKALIILLILFFFQSIFTNIHHPLMPSYVKDLNLPDFMFGFFFAFMNLGMMIGAPLWGFLADSGKKRLSVVLGFFIYATFQLLFGFGSFFGPFLLSVIRFFSGFGIAAAFSVLAGEIIIVSNNKNRAFNIALGALMLGVGGAFGQYIGGMLYTNPWFINLLNQDPVFNMLLLQFITMMLLGIATYFLYKPATVIKEGKTKKIGFFESFRELKKISSDLLVFLIALTLITIAATNVDKYLDVYFINELGFLEDKLGEFKMIVGLVSAFSSLLIVPIFMRFKRRLFIISLFQIISAILIFIIFNDTSFSFIFYIYSLYMIYIVLKTINEPLERDHISNYSSNENVSIIMGVRHSFFALGTIIGPIFGAFIYDYNKTLVFNVSAVIFVISIILIFISYLLRKRSEVKL